MKLKIFLFTFFMCVGLSNLVFAEERYPGARKLSGAWLITFHLEERPEFLPETINVLGNFTRDGSFLFSTDIPTLEIQMPTGEFELFRVGEGHGVWKRIGRRKFSLQSTALVQMALEPETLVALGGGSAELFLSKDGDELNPNIS